MSNINYRLGTEHDLVQIMNIEKMCFSDENSFLPDYFEIFMEYYFYVAEHESKIIGYIIGLPMIPEFDRNPTVLKFIEKENLNNIIIINTLAVIDSYRNQGVGTGLINLLIENVKLSCCVKAIGLQVRSDNHNAIKAYTKNKFNLSDIFLPNYYQIINGDTKDGLFMYRRI